MKLTEKAARAITELRGNPHFRNYVEWLKENEAKALKQCVTQQDVVLYRAQGRAELLDTQLRLIADAPDVVMKIELGKGEYA